MPDKKMDQNPPVPPQAKEEARRSVTNARKAAEDLRFGRWRNRR